MLKNNNTKQILIHDTPGSQGVLNVIKRTKQMLNIKWTPIKPFPKLIKKKEKRYFPAGKQVIGLPYTSVRVHEKFVGINLSFETFLSAVQNPGSMIYTENMFGRIKNAAGYYGMVCSVFVSYALNLPFRVPTKLWAEIKGMHKVQHKSEYDVKLCDTLLNKRHVAIIIDITRTLEGRVHSISVAESTRPKCKCTELSPEQFEDIWIRKKECDVYRYDHLASVPYEPSPYVQVEDEPPVKIPLNKVLGLNLGNKANYRRGEPVVYNIMQDGWETLLIYKDGHLLETVELMAKQRKITRNYLECGHFEAFCENSEKKTSTGVCFEVVHISLDVDKTSLKPGEETSLFFSVGNMSDIPLCLTWNTKETKNTLHIHEFASDEAVKGQVDISWPDPGTFSLKIYARNDYGIYPSEYIDIHINLS